MENWEIDDETMMKIYDEWEQHSSKTNNDVNLEVDFVSETPLKVIPPISDGGTTK